MLHQKYLDTLVITLSRGSIMLNKRKVIKKMNKNELLETAIPVPFFRQLSIKGLLDKRKVEARFVVDTVVIDESCEITEDELRRISKYQVGDTLCVQEPYLFGDYDRFNKSSCSCCDPAVIIRQDVRCNTLIYQEDAFYEFTDNCESFYWHSPISMPKECSRVFLRITKVRLQRLNNITVEEIKKEGVDNIVRIGCPIDFDGSDSDTMDEFLFARFKHEWDASLNDKSIDEYGWACNPWVIVTELEHILVDRDDKY